MNKRKMNDIDLPKISNMKSLTTYQMIFKREISGKEGAEAQLQIWSNIGLQDSIHGDGWTLLQFASPKLQTPNYKLEQYRSLVFFFF